MKLYNSLTKTVEEFKPRIEDNTVLMYSCGPTVYSRAHLGNFSAYLMSDLLVRWFKNRHLFNPKEKPWKVKKISNITDVGHLVSDGDEGEDKMEKAAKEQEKSVLEIAKHWEDLYREDEKKLNIQEADTYPRATEYVKQMIDFIKDLEDKGYAYETEDGVYFEVEKFADYGKLSGNTLDKIQAGAGGRVEEENQVSKKNPADFALWKKLVGQNEKHSLKWDSPWGEGFPGWHIECSAMILTNLGEQIDLHTGGEDNIFPHHECEIAQMEAKTGKKPFCHHWMHKRFIQLNAEKMAKSKGNVINLDDVIEKGFSPLDLRFLFLKVHYRQQLNFTWENLEVAREERKKIQNLYQKIQDSNIQSEIDHTDDARKKFFQNMEEDLNVSGALSVIHSFIRISNIGLEKSNLNTEKAKKFLEDFDKVFGILEKNKTEELPIEIQNLKNQRQQARENKDFAESDRLRDEIQNLGYRVEDSAEGQKIYKA